MEKDPGRGNEENLQDLRTLRERSLVWYNGEQRRPYFPEGTKWIMSVSHTTILMKLIHNPNTNLINADV